MSFVTVWLFNLSLWNFAHLPSQPTSFASYTGYKLWTLSLFICVYCCDATVKTNVIVLFIVFKISIGFLVITIYKTNKSVRLDIDSPIIWECVIRNNEMILKEVFVSVSTKTCESYCIVINTCIIFPFLWW